MRMNSLPAFADLRILATSDVHMHLTGWDALRNDIVAGRGLDGLARRIQAARQGAPGLCLLMDNGDFLQGTPVGAECAQAPQDTPHPWAAMVNALDYDAIGLGNHDFDFGIALLESVVAQTNAPTLCASFSMGGVAGVLPQTLLRRDVRGSDGRVRALTIGVTSVLPPHTLAWNQRFLAGKIAFDPGVIAAERAVSDLKQQGADIVVLLCHSGLTSNGADTSENFAAQVAQSVKGIDALVMGHTHRLFPKPGNAQDVHGIVAVMPGYGAEALGVIDLRLGWDGHGWSVAKSTSSLHAARASDRPSARLTELAAPAIIATRRALDVELTQTETGFHSYFDMLRPGLAGTIVARSMMRCIADAVRGTPLAALPLLASVAPMAVGGQIGPTNFAEVAPGPVRARHVAVLSPFRDAIWGAVLPGRDLFAWVERASDYYAPKSDALAHLVDPNAPSFNFDMLYGLEAVIDPFAPRTSGPDGQPLGQPSPRVLGLSYQCKPIDPDQPFLVALTSYRAGGGGRYPGLDDDTQIVRTQADQMAALRSDVAQFGLPDPDPTPAWRFACPKPRRVIIHTSPNAQAHLHDIASFDPKVVGTNATGFLELNVAI